MAYAASALVDHLVAAHCDATPSEDDSSPIQQFPDLADVVDGALDVDADIAANVANVDVEAETHLRTQR